MRWHLLVTALAVAGCGGGAPHRGSHPHGWDKTVSFRPVPREQAGALIGPAQPPVVISEPAPAPCPPAEEFNPLPPAAEPAPIPPEPGPEVKPAARMAQADPKPDVQATQHQGDWEVPASPGLEAPRP